MSYDKDSLILAHLDLAKNIATREWRTATHALKHDDMLSLANLGLVDAADRWEAYCKKNEYDPTAVQYFKVFASLRIRGTIRDYIRSSDWATRTLRSKAKKLKEAGQDEGLPLSELSEKTGMSVVEINKVNARLNARPVSLEAHLSTTYEDSGSAPNELKDAVDTEASAFSRDILSTFVATVKNLTYEHQVILALHYFSRLDLRRISELLDIPETKVFQLHAEAVVAVKDALTNAAVERG
jgi:RNA polymerase sigma factor for flagellar operon FliA